MSSRIPWYVVSLLLVGCGTILWFFWDQIKKRRRQNKKEIFISADCWLEVFDLLPPYQLGLEIAMISHRFDRRVDEHFKTRKWTLGDMEIRSKIGENGANEMELVNSANEKALPIPQNPLSNKVIGFKRILIYFFDRNVLTFLRHFLRFSSICTTFLFIRTENVQVAEFVVLTIWPMLKDSVRLMNLTASTFRQMRQLAPSLLNDCPSLHRICIYDGILPEFPPDDSANLSDGQAVTKWLFTPLPNNLPKVLTCCMNSPVEEEQWATIVEQIKAAFSNASAPLNFCIFISFRLSAPFDSVLPFELINQLTGEELILIKHANAFKLFHCPIAHEEQIRWKTAMYNQLYARQNQIDISIRDDEVDESLLDDVSSAEPSGDH